jgi:hypothetical protein
MFRKKDQFKKLLKEHIAGELQDPEVKAAKKAFLEENFAPAPPWFVGSGLWLVLGLSLALAVGMIHLYLQAPKLAPKEYVSQTPITDVLPEMGQELGPVVVSRLSSRVGSTMLYQKQAGGVPITIVWVFVGGK